MLRSSNAVYYGLVLLLLCLWALYFVSPIDLLPDMIPVLGRLDDLGALVGLYWYLRRLRMARGSQTAHGDFRSTPHGEKMSKDTHSEADSVAAEDPWQVLHLAPGASPEQIHAAYKEQLLQYHPDRVAHLGEELQRLAHRKTLAINQAYDLLKQQQS
jgi:uncharacterized membrane protein YkvA (DUF1232 family)